MSDKLWFGPAKNRRFSDRLTGYIYVHCGIFAARAPSSSHANHVVSPMCLLTSRLACLFSHIPPRRARRNHTRTPLKWRKQRRSTISKQKESNPIWINFIVSLQKCVKSEVWTDNLNLVTCCTVLHAAQWQKHGKRGSLPCLTLPRAHVFPGSMGQATFRVHWGTINIFLLASYWDI